MGTKQLLMEITELKPNEKLAITGRSGMPLLPTQTFILHSCAEGCELTLDVVMRTSGFWSLMAPVLPMMLKKIWKQYFIDLEKLLKGT